MDDLLKISLLGRVDLQWNGRPVAGLTTRKAKAMLIYLICTGRSQSRELLAELLWPDRPQGQALHNLRSELARLNQALPAYILSTRQTLAFNRSQAHWLDMIQLEQELTTRQESQLTEAQAKAVDQALDLYQGDFLTGFYLNDAPDFEAWISLERERLHRLAIEGLHRLVSYYLATGQYKVGLERARRLLALDQFDEVAHSQLMRLLVWNQQRDAALRHFAGYKQLLAREMGLEPDPEIRMLAEQIKSGELSGAAQTSPLPSCPDITVEAGSGTGRLQPDWTDTLFQPENGLNRPQPVQGAFSQQVVDHLAGGLTNPAGFPTAVGRGLAQIGRLGRRVIFQPGLPLTRAAGPEVGHHQL
jgi:DNA-binding SARP family transcriptional activator